jgi:dipeptidyl aminopeptidase/acylaminoacyl peptidase
MGDSGFRPGMMTALDIHAQIELLRTPFELVAHRALPIAACLLATGPDGELRVHLVSSAPGFGTPIELDLDEGIDCGLLRWSGPTDLICATRGSDGECSTLTALSVPSLGFSATATVAWTMSMPGAIEDIRPGADGMLVLVAAYGTERDGSHLGTRVGPAGDPMIDRTDRARRSLYVVAADGSRCTEVPADGFNVWAADRDDDGNVVAVVSSDPRQAGFYASQLIRIDGVTGVITPLYQSQWQLAQPRLSADGRTALVVEGLSIVSGPVLSIDVGTGATRRWPDIDDVTDLGWIDTERMWFAGWHRTGVQVGTADRDGNKIERWTSPGSLHGPDGQPTLTLTADGDALAVAEMHGSPAEVVRLQFGEPGWTAVTELNRATEHLVSGVISETVSWVSTDGLEIDGIVIRRAHAIGPQPLVVIAHGGPTWLWSEAFAPAESNNLALPLVHAGAVVLLPNPRGSSGRGQEFARGVIGEVGGLDLEDVIAGVDVLVHQGLVDPARTSIIGSSYGGYLAALAATDIRQFRAAVVMSGVSDWLSFRTTSNLGGGYDHVYHQGIGPGTADGREKLVSVSPVYRVGKESTPTLILHGQLDRTTPLVQAEMLHRAFRFAEVPTELVVYPGEGHEFVDAAHRTDAAHRVLSWLEEHGVLG